MPHKDAVIANLQAIIKLKDRNNSIRDKWRGDRARNTLTCMKVENTVSQITPAEFEKLRFVISGVKDNSIPHARCGRIKADVLGVLERFLRDALEYKSNLDKYVSLGGSTTRGISSDRLALNSLFDAERKEAGQISLAQEKANAEQAAKDAERNARNVQTQLTTAQAQELASRPFGETTLEKAQRFEAAGLTSQLDQEELLALNPPDPVTIPKYYTWTTFNVIRGGKENLFPNRPDLVFPQVRRFALLTLEIDQVELLEAQGFTILLADKPLTEIPMAQGIEEINKIARRNVGIKEINLIG